MIDRNLSFSQIKAWQDCRRKWGYLYRDGYKPKQPSLEFMRGSLLHLGMEYGCKAWADGDYNPTADPWQTACRAWNKEWAFAGDNMIVDPAWMGGCEEIVAGALQVFQAHWRIIGDASGPLIERRLYASLHNGTYRGVVFIPDAVCEKLQDPFKGGVFGVDFKSYGKPKLPIAGDVDLQGAIYQHGLREKGYPAMGSCLFQLATEPRKAIRLKKDGEPYAGDQERYDGWAPVRGQLVTQRPDEFLEGIWTQVVLPVAKEMHDAEITGGNDHLTPRLDYYGCQYCEFFAPCQARLKGYDEGAILADQFNQRAHSRSEKRRLDVQAPNEGV